MRFLADMGVDVRVVEWPRGEGHDAVHLREEGLHRAPDEQVFAKALAEERIVLTFDLAVFGSRTGRPGFTRAIQQFTHRFRVARPRPVPYAGILMGRR